MKGILYKSKEGWMVKYTTYKTIPGIKGIMGSHSRMPESNYLPVHPDTKLYPDGLWGQANIDDFETVDFEIVEQFMPYDNFNSVHKFAKLINEEKSTKHSKQNKHTLSKETLDELFQSHDREDFMDVNSKNWWEKNKKDYVEIGLEDEVLIELEDWNHTCGDGCCSTYGTNIYINGEQIEDEDGMNPHQLLQAVLTKLGYTNVKVEYK